jgi:hypothetical protein
MDEKLSVIRSEWLNKLIQEQRDVIDYWLRLLRLLIVIN